MPSGPYRMIAIDLDGTLLSPEGRVSPRTKQAIHHALQAGLLVCFATGRNWTESRTVLQAVNHFATCVFVGGAMVIDTDKRVTLHRTLMPPDLASDVCRILEGDGHAVLACQDTHHAGVDYLVTDNIPLNEATDRWMHTTSSAIRRVPSLAHYPHPHTVRVGICASFEDVAIAKRHLDEVFGPRILCQSLFVPMSRVEIIEVFDPAVSKWQGVLHLAAHHGVTPAQIIAIGDDINDLPMIQNAGLGVAMGNAKPAVLAAAKKTIGSNADDGLAVFLEELLAEHIVKPINPASQEAAA